MIEQNSASIKWIEQTASTNSLLSDDLNSAHGEVIAARVQTAGRGQRGNHWESEPYKNLTFSMSLRPSTIEASRQFELSMLVSLGICDALKAATGLDFEIKWPNDIYYRNCKICGILIENSLNGSHISRSIAGIGINVNQRRFLSDAPNPTSLVLLTQREYDLESLLKDICDSILSRFNSYELNANAEALSRDYHQHLWRREGIHLWTDTATNQTFRASIESVGLDGILKLRLEDGSISEYAFKEVSSVL